MSTEPTHSTSTSLPLGVLLALTGGFLDAFTYVAHGGVFANSQTGNIVLFGIELSRQHWASAFLHFPAILAFIIGVFMAETIFHPRVAQLLRRPARIALAAEIIVLLIVGTLPNDFNDTTIVVFVAFTAALQSSAFTKIGTWSYNSVITTGNLRTTMQHAYRALVLKKPESARQARTFGVIVLSFFTGALTGAIITPHLGNYTAWLAAAVLSVGLLLFILDQTRERRA
jgi:uncharacterized membrane protein YoaK (UPF0700 family)